MSRRNPFEEIEDLLGRLGGEFGGGLSDLDPRSVAVDVRDGGEEYVVTADLPGYDREDLTVELADGDLRVGAGREERAEAERDEDGGRYLRRERHRRSVSRTVRLPQAVDADGVSATYSNGVLTVTLPKREGGDATTIDID